MGYSKISSIELINFMSFKQAKVMFDETGIINIKGYNDSGKSAILRGLVVCLMDMFKRNQVKFIRHGEEYFRVVVTFDDGVSIIRDKYSNGQSLYEVYKGAECVFTTKQGNKLSKVDGVPEPIQEYLGLCVTDSVYLNYQSCVDKLPVVDTTGSENYQMFHEVLRMEEIYRANAMINADKNELGARIAEIELAVQRDEVLLEKCGDVSQEFIDEIVKLEKESEITAAKKSFLDEIRDVADKYDRIESIPSIEKVSVDRLKSVSEIANIVSSLDSTVSIPEIKKVEMGRLRVLYDMYSACDKVVDTISIPELKPVDVSRRNTLDTVVASFNSLARQLKECSDIDNKLGEVRSTLDKLMKDAKAQGIEFVKCENCGSYTIAGGGHTHG